tara:strand:- start:33 stop:323 length:291 start_codon:yes stop_codon:yes gene_type:complete
MTKRIIYDFSTKETVTRDLTSEEQKELDALKPNAKKKLEYLRAERNSLLNETDYLALSDVTMSDAWKNYRQELRDITKTFQSMEDKDFKFPTKPTE